jgi:rhodanese-related sulfurtransferase
VPGFEKMYDELISHSIPLVSPKALSLKKDVIILDAREKNEYQVSHILGATLVGYEEFDLAKLPRLPLDTEIYVYCSVGYRSEKIAENLKNSGYKNVSNLEGGIFSWVNQGYPVVDNKNKRTKLVHGYSLDWIQWLNEDKCKPFLE